MKTKKARILEEFRKRTIASVEVTAMNQWCFHFEDGEKLVVEADTEYIGNGNSLPVLRLVVE